MKRTCCYLLVLALASLPAVGVAQTDTKADPKTPAEAPKDTKADPAAPATTDATKKDDPKDATTPATTPATTTADPNKGPVTGPGGRTLRTDYPGKEDALKSQMETDGLKTSASVEEKSKVYDTRIQELERKIDDMKQGVFRSKSRIVLLRETLLGGRNAGSRAVIVHRSKINDRFTLKRALYRMDGNSILNEIDRKGSLNKEKLTLYNGSIGPGTHKLVVILQYAGKSAVFKYFEGYDFELKTVCDFNVKQGQTTTVEVEVFKGGNVTTSVEDKPKIRCNVRFTDLDAAALEKAAKTPTKKK